MPRMTAPASRSRLTMKPSREAGIVARAAEPPVAGRSAFSKLSLRTMEDTVPDAAHASRAPFAVQRGRLFARPRVEADHRVDARPAAVVGVDAGEVGVHERGRGGASACHRGLEVADGGFVYFERGGSLCEQVRRKREREHSRYDRSKGRHAGESAPSASARSSSRGPSLDGRDGHPCPESSPGWGADWAATADPADNCVKNPG